MLRLLLTKLLSLPSIALSVLCGKHAASPMQAAACCDTTAQPESSPAELNLKLLHFANYEEMPVAKEHSARVF